MIEMLAKMLANEMIALEITIVLHMLYYIFSLRATLKYKNQIINELKVQVVKLMNRLLSKDKQRTDLKNESTAILDKQTSLEKENAELRKMLLNSEEEREKLIAGRDNALEIRDKATAENKRLVSANQVL